MVGPEEWRRVHKVDVSSMQKKCRSAPASQKARANCMAKNKRKIAWKPQTEALEGSQSSRNAISSYSTGACTLWSLPEESRCGPLNLTTTEDRCFRQQAQGHSERRSSVPEDGSRQERNFETGWHLRAAATKFGTAFNLAWNTTAWRRDCGCRCCSRWRARRCWCTFWPQQSGQWLRWRHSGWYCLFTSWVTIRHSFSVHKAGTVGGCVLRWAILHRSRLGCEEQWSGGNGPVLGQD